MFFIISAHKEGRHEAANTYYTHRLMDVLNDLGYVWEACDGVYRGKREVSIRVALRRGCDFDKMRSVLCWLARPYDQESVLLVDNDGTGHLINVVTGQSSIIGTWKPVAAGMPVGLSAYTIIDGVAYACL